MKATILTLTLATLFLMAVPNTAAAEDDQDPCWESDFYPSGSNNLLYTYGDPGLNGLGFNATACWWSTCYYAWVAPAPCIS